MIYQEYRCQACNKLMFKGILVDSAVEVKCRVCHAMNTFTGLSKEKLLCYTEECPRRTTKEDAAREGKRAVSA